MGLETIDIIGPQVMLSINQNTRFKTKMGGLLTILVLIVTLLATISFGIDIIERKNPKIFVTQQFQDYPSLDADAPKFFITLWVKGAIRIKDIMRKFTLRAELADVGKEKTSFSTKYMIPCSQSNYVKANTLNITRQFSLPIEDYWCLPNEFDWALEGKFGKRVFKNYNFYLSFCKNETMNNTCYSVSEIKKELSRIDMNFIYLDHYIDPISFETPSPHVWNAEIIEGNLNSGRTDIFTFKNTEIVTDKGAILKESETMKTFQFASRLTYVTLDSPDIFCIQITLSEIKDTYVRTYLKLQ